MVTKELRAEEIKWKTRNVKDENFLNKTSVEIKVGDDWKKITLKDLQNQPNYLDARIEEDNWLRLVCKNNVKNDFTDGGRKVYGSQDKDSTVKKDEVIYGNLATPRSIGVFITNYTHGNFVTFDKYLRVMDSDMLEPFNDYLVSHLSNFRTQDSFNYFKGKSTAIDVSNKEILRPHLDKEIIFDVKVLRVGIDNVGLPGASRPGNNNPRHEVLLNISISPCQKLFDKLKEDSKSITMAEIEKGFSIGYEDADDYIRSHHHNNEECYYNYREAGIPKYIAKQVIEMKKNGQGNQEIKPPLIDSGLVETTKRRLSSLENNRSYAIRLNKGAKIKESLEKFALERSDEIGFAEFSMIGITTIIF